MVILFVALNEIQIICGKFHVAFYIATFFLPPEMPADYSYSLKELRLALGLNQDLMAGLLQTKRSLLSMAELGHRSVGAPALIRVRQISQLLPQPGEVGLGTESLTPKISDWLERLRVERFRLKKRIEKQKSGKTKSALLSVVLNNLDSLQSPDFDPAQDKLWKAMMESAQPDPEETEWEIFRLTVELEALDWKIGRLGTER